MAQSFVNNNICPIISGRSLRPDEFFNRDAELRTIFNRLRQCESTAVVGEPHIGKTSLLYKIEDKDTQREYLGKDADSMIVSFHDMHQIGNDYTISDFWSEVLSKLYHVLDPSLQELLTQTEKRDYDRRILNDLFHYMGKRKFLLVLLLDEFEILLRHHHFIKNPSFFALIRSLANHTGGLAIITASRLSVGKMNEIGRGLLDTGSPFFNTMMNCRLQPFDMPTCIKFLQRIPNVNQSHHNYIFRITGRHPYLLQTMAAILTEIEGENIQEKAAECFYERISSHFDDLWHYMDEKIRTTSLILSLLELGRIVLGQRFDCSEFENISAFGPQLRELEKMGLAEQISKGWQLDLKNLFIWRGERWIIGSMAYAWWIRDVVISGSRPISSFNEWLKNKHYRFLITQEQWERLVHHINNIREFIDVPKIAKKMFEDITGVTD